MSRFTALLTILAVAWTGLVSGIALDAQASAPVASKGIPALSVRLPACISEDSTYNCYWDAQTRGNRQGTSFIVYNGEWYYEG